VGESLVLGEASDQGSDFGQIVRCGKAQTHRGSALSSYEEANLSSG
jgi:hypothetical protein